MALAPGFHDVPPGMVATVVTHLEMRAPPPARPGPLPAGIALTRIAAPTPDWYRDLYTRVGRDWLWFSRLQMPEEELAAILSDPDVEIWALEKDGRAEGLLELDFRQQGACELAFFGLTGALIGKGAGRFLMSRAIASAWARPISRFHVHTCTLDSPGALAFYRRSGFTPMRQQIEIAADPRLTDDLPRDAGSHIPLFDG
ncbi:GNAT family N-acetyltransferase [Pseudodonghicola flavimaris]|uniref:GNAT family N-acetyltransferase n=1 Tax=Pseudodonghicola flavimaris TaxID=3050036 RepID=A0ABT7EWA9_9RHOB|nr:GNAT family N-acetyltransferase [Pseudodonghicola flavimaris]MDK3016626.1 GNAT family N-acetyltransferase [Pseudodonghicola flavimaris]